MRGLDEIDDGLSALGDLAALFGAASTDDLWRALTLGAGLPSAANSWDAEMLWHHHHGDGQAGAADTALLLCTDWRWRRATAGLIAAIAGSGVLDKAGLTELASRFLEGTTITWTAPLGWSDGEWVTIRLVEETDDDTAEISGDDGAGPLNIARRVPPPLHRWAAAQLVRSHPGEWADVWEGAQRLDAAGTGAALAGMLDVLEVLGEPAASDLLALGLSWPRGSVRRTALERLAEREGPDAARRLAAVDPDAKIREWAEKLARGRSAVTSTSASTVAAAARSHDPSGDIQPTLFEV
ncbi:MAG: hypothetical protein JWM18_700 [Chloroflexi bacterium]|jgi:hypothetical protein|nr:hypothetical protein [Chloroflexota bacterium]